MLCLARKGEAATVAETAEREAIPARRFVVLAGIVVSTLAACQGMRFL